MVRNKNMEQETKNLLSKTFMLAQVLVVGVLVFLVGQMIYHSQLLNIQNQNQITVFGEGKVYAKPDIAVVNIGVTAQDATVAEVTKNGTTKMNVVIEAVKALKIDEKDIKSTNYNLAPVYENSTIYAPVPMMYPSPDIAVSRTSTTIKGYKLDQSIEVKIRDFTKISDVLDQATKSGANTVGNLQFTIDNPEQFREQARAEAIKKAKDNAKNLAKESGIKLGKIINIYENSGPYPVMYDSVMAKGMGSVESAPAPTIEPGQQEITVTINLTYKIK